MQIKSALVISTHTINSKRIGGFHRFVQYLLEEDYIVDWMTCPVHIGWLISNNDRENSVNYFQLKKGIRFGKEKKSINFAVPFMIPGKVEKKVGFRETALKTPSWSKVRNRLKNEYDLILIETIGCDYAEDIIHDYPTAKIIYRPSDILESLIHEDRAIEIEKKMISVADKTLCVDENAMNYYISKGVEKERLSILRNPLSNEKDIEFLKYYNPKEKERKSVVYVGVSFFYEELVEYSAKKNTNVDYIIIGPFNKKSHDNIKYVGSLDKKEYEEYLKNSDVGISPIKQEANTVKSGVVYGYTGKIISYMKFLLPIVATCGSNYLNIKGFYTVENDCVSFNNAIEKCLNLTIDERKDLRKGYLFVLKEFNNANCKQRFQEYVKKKQ